MRTRESTHDASVKCGRAEAPPRRVGNASRARRAVTGALLFAFATALQALSLLRGPVIGRPDDASVAVSWITDTPADSRVDYAVPGGVWTTVRFEASVTRHEVALGGLSSGTTYRYRIFSDDVALGEEGTFRAPRDASEQTFRFGVIGDTDLVEVPALLAERLTESDVDFALHTGDVVYPAGAEKDYDREFFVPMARWLSHGAVLPTLGNHDVMTEDGAAYLADFALPKNDATHDSRFYAFRHANALFVCLDVESSTFGAGSPQYRWLERTLRDATADWKFVYLHPPLYSSANPDRLARLILGPLLERYGVDIVFSGHEHLYERTYPIRDFVTQGRGVVYVTEGGGGADLTAFSREEYSAYVAGKYGYVEIEIDGKTLTLSAHDTGGSVFDSVILAKAPSLVARTPPNLAARRHRHRGLVLE